VGAISLAVGLGAASSALGFATFDGVRTRWPHDPTYRIVNASSTIDDGSEVAAIRAAFQTWQDVEGASISFQEVQRDGEITVAFVQQWPPEVGESVVGLAVTTHQAGVISASEVTINEDGYQWATDGNPLWLDVQGVTTHEVGHAVGLLHSRVRTATMYWADANAEARSLDPDDARGLVFLYGDGPSQGQVCDTCESSRDCADGGICMTLSDDLKWCGARCGRGVACPEGSVCSRLPRLGMNCVPQEGFCSDGGGQGQLGIGDYCWGQAQCAPGGTCLPFAGGAAACTPTCQVPQDCPAGTTCLEKLGACVARGNTAFGAACTSDLECQSLVCLVLDADNAVCSDACDPANNNCPGGVECDAVQGVPGALGYCRPSGQVPEGGDCPDAAHRCGPGLQCVYETADGAPVCRASCEPFGQCGPGRGCTPYNFADWYCLPLDRPAAGTPCDPDAALCQGGLYCLRIDNVDGVCVAPCDDLDAQGCGGNACLEVDGPEGNLGACSPGAGALGAPCVARYECLDFQCLNDGSGGICSHICSADAPCPAGFVCGPTDDGQQLCFRDAAIGAGGAAGTGGEPGAGGSQAMGGTPAAGGEPGAGGSPAMGGTPAAGGEPGAGGSVATGGTPGAGGTSAAGGIAAAGGSAATGGTGGSATAGGASGGPPGTDAGNTSGGVTGGDAGASSGTTTNHGGSSGGCALAVPGRATGAPGAVLALVGLGLGASRRRRRPVTTPSSAGDPA